MHWFQLKVAVAAVAAEVGAMEEVEVGAMEEVEVDHQEENQATTVMMQDTRKLPADLEELNMLPASSSQS